MDQVLYGSVDQKTSRFQVVGDNRRMYPISAVGGLVGSEAGWVRTFDGAVEQKNLVPLNGSLAQFCIDTPEGAVIVATRLGVTGNSGGNVLLNGNPGSVSSGGTRVTLLGADNVMIGGEISMRTTLPATAPTNNPNPAANSYGSIYELYTVGGTTVAAFSSGAGSVVSSAALSTLALTTNYAAYTNGPVVPLATPGDVIRLQNTGATLFSYHRISNIAGTTITINPNTVFANAGASTFSVLRTGNMLFATTSRVVPVLDSATGSRYIYYSGGSNVLQCVKYDGTTNQTSHFMAPRQGAGADWFATDIISYKGYLLYGFGGAISWSVSGFPTSFTTGFGPTDLPATNTTVVSLSDTFQTFEILGDQLLAFFNNSIWQVQATGTVPEFQFYRLAEPVSASILGQGGAYRNTVSARGAVYYFSSTGLMELAGQTAQKISYPVDSLLVGFSDNNSAILRDLTWEPFTDSIIASIDIGNANNSQALTSMAYHRPTKTWWQPDLTFASISLHGITGGSAGNPPDGLGASVFYVDLGFYDAVTEKLVFSSTLGGPASITINGPHATTWSWKSLVVSMGDNYGMIQGFQVDGNLAINAANWQIFGGPSPYSLTQRASGAVNSLTNRILLGQKIDDPFIQIRLTSVGAPNGIGPIKQFVGVNLYTIGSGR